MAFSRFRWLQAAFAGAFAAGQTLAATPACSAHAEARRPVVVELYTSEGCSSCPPADRWLSSLKGQSGVLALAFHVDYWDSLGWTDRFASPQYTERQHQLQRSSHARFVYTPQVLVDGQDWRRWPGPLPTPAEPATVDLQLRREGAQVLALVSPRRTAAPGQPAGQLAGYWAVLEDDHASAVQAGENAGATLHHDHVVRRYQPVPAWPAGQAQQLRWALPANDEPGGHERRIVFVVIDPASGRPVQALALGC